MLFKADEAMFKSLKSLLIVSRAEFLLPNLGSLIMGLAWGVAPPVSFVNFAVLIALAFIIINLSSAIGAQVNTLSDHELDSKDNRKKHLVQAMDSFKRNHLKILLIVELLLTLALVSLFMFVQGRPILLVMWVAGISLGCAYSAPPLRVKSRSWQAPIALVLVLAVFPVLFAYYTFASEMEPLFLLSLVGLALTVYGVIIPTEIRDYFGDKAMGIETMTVRIGLVKSCLLGMVLLTTGSVCIGTSFVLKWISGSYPLLSLLVLAIPVAVVIVLRNFRKLYSLSEGYESSRNDATIAEQIVSLSAHNPKWIMLVTQTYSVMSIMLLISKSLF